MALWRSGALSLWSGQTQEGVPLRRNQKPTNPVTSHTVTLGKQPTSPILLVLGMILRGLLGWQHQPIALSWD